VSIILILLLSGLSPSYTENKRVVEGKVEVINIDTNIVVQYLSKGILFTSNGIRTYLSAESYNFMGDIKNRTVHELCRLHFNNVIDGYQVHHFAENAVSMNIYFDSSIVNIEHYRMLKENGSSTLDTSVSAYATFFPRMDYVLFLFTINMEKLKHRYSGWVHDQLASQANLDSFLTELKLKNIQK
jgi:hypothetical protein